MCLIRCTGAFLFDSCARRIGIDMNRNQNHLHLVDYLRTRAINGDENTALIAQSISGQRYSLSWLELGKTVEALSISIDNKLRAMPNTPRRIGYASDNTIGSVLLALTCMNLGVIEFPFDNRLDPSEIDGRWNSIGGLWVEPLQIESFIQNSSVIKRFNTFARDQHASPDDPSLVIWTSGTSGKPKGVTLTSKNLTGNAQAKLNAVPQRREDRRLTVLPLCHAYARTCDLGTWLISGCTLAVSLGYQGLRIQAPIVQPTLINLVPSLAERLLKDKEVDGLSDLRLLGCGGAVLAEKDYREWSTERGVTVIQGYGLTEASPVVCSATPKLNKAGCVGQFVEGWEYRIQTEQLYVRGPHVMRGYWNEPGETQLKIDAEGWLATGDQVELDSKTNQIKVLGRIDDVLVLNNAVKIQPQSIELRVNVIKGVKQSMLLQRKSVELWIDLEPTNIPVEKQQITISEQVRKLVGKKIGFLPYSIHYFDETLGEEELTMKGTLRRRQIMRNRFSN